MTYQGGGDVSSLLVPANSASTIRMSSGAVAHLVAPGSSTAGRYGLFRWEMPPRSGGAKPHFHRTFSESFYVLTGTIELWTGTAWRVAGANDLLYVPEGGIHGFRNDGDAAASMLILFAPGHPRERYFEELADIGRSRRQLSAAEWAELYARHDQYMVQGVDPGP
jgi:mannose-6-phosphate isomerase-like protein (cupin superfamily)